MKDCLEVKKKIFIIGEVWKIKFKIKIYKYVYDNSFEKYKSYFMKGD